MTRRAAGSKKKLADGVWRLWISAGHDAATGKRSRPTRVFHGTEREADLELARMLSQAGRHASTSMTLWEFIETMYLPSIEPPELRRRTVDEYRKKLEKYVKTAPIGSTRLDRLTRFAMVSWMRTVKASVANKQTQLHVYRALSAALSKAVSWGVMDENLLRVAVDPPTPDEYVPPVLAEDEANAYLDAFSGHQLEPVVVLAISGGFRPSEIYALGWSDIDLKSGAVSVTKGLHQRDGETWYEPAKSRTSNRVVMLPPWAVDALKPHRKVGRVCGELTPDQVSYRYKRHVQDSELKPWCPIENLRHTHATIGIEAGVDWTDMAHRLGHSSTKMVQQRYAKRRLLRDTQTAGVIEAFRKPGAEKAREAK